MHNDNFLIIGYDIGYNKAINKFTELCVEAAYIKNDAYVVDMRDIQRIVEKMKGKNIKMKVIITGHRPPRLRGREKEASA